MSPGGRLLLVGGTNGLVTGAVEAKEGPVQPSTLDAVRVYTSNKDSHREEPILRKYLITVGVFVSPSDLAIKHPKGQLVSLEVIRALSEFPSQRQQYTAHLLQTAVLSRGHLV